MTGIIEEIDELEEDTQKGKYLIFSIGSEEYGIEIKYVTEIIGIQAITPIPEMPMYIKGVINLRGKIIPVMDVRLRFGKELRAYDDRTCIIVVEIKDISVGLIIDTVLEVLTIEDSEISEPPQLKKAQNHSFIKGIGRAGENVKLLLDCDKLLNDEEAENISQVI